VCFPWEPTEPTVPFEIQEVSPNFKTLHSEALAAESYGLTEIAGIGFRKALEFLINDYCAGLHPDEADKV
jgi:hypothetical protein